MPKADKAERLDELERIDDLLEHRVRLAICVLLTRDDAITFTRLRDILNETDGSLGTHLRKLEDVGYLALERTFLDRRPVTWYRFTSRGRKQLDRHLESLAALIDRVR